MGNGPPLGDIEAESFRQLRSGSAGDGILPSSERNQQIPVLVKGKIAMHHAGNAHGGNIFPVFKPLQGSLQACPDLVKIISPDAVSYVLFRV